MRGGNGYAANLEKAVSRPTPPAVADPDGNLSPEEFHTPNRKTIAEVAAFTGLPETSQIKSLVMVAGGKPVLALLRGDHSLSETKFGAVAGGDARPAHPEEIRQSFGADAGSLGPVGVKNMRIIADNALKDRRNMICGANKDDYHLRNVTPGEDFEAVWSPDGARLYATVGSNSNVAEYGLQEEEGRAAVWEIDPATGALTKHGEAIPLPTRPIHMTTDIPSQNILVAFNNPSALQIYRINPDFTPGEEVRQEALDTGIFAHQVPRKIDF